VQSVLRKPRPAPKTCRRLLGKLGFYVCVCMCMCIFLSRPYIHTQRIGTLMHTYMHIPVLGHHLDLNTVTGACVCVCVYVYLCVYKYRYGPRIIVIPTTRRHAHKLTHTHNPLFLSFSPSSPLSLSTHMYVYVYIYMCVHVPTSIEDALVGIDKVPLWLGGLHLECHGLGACMCVRVRVCE
jgi:hypothetical protein